MRVLVEPGLLGWPVVLLQPGVHEGAQHRDVRAVAPADAVDLVGPTGAAEPAAKVVEDGGLDVDLEGLNGHGGELSYLSW
jgi:hypothetical protein